MQTLRDQHAVVAIELDDVGYSAQRDQIEQAVQTRFRARVVERTAPAQLCAQCEQHVEHDADARNAFARELAPWLVRIDDGACRRQFVAGQMVVRDEHVDTERIRGLHPVDAGNAVVHRDQQIRLAGSAARRERHDFGRQAVAIFEAVRHQIVDARAKHAQAAHRDRAGGGAVAIVIGDHQHATLRQQRIREQHGRVFAAFEPGGRHELGEAGFDFIGLAYAARCVKTRQHRMQAVTGQDFGVDGRTGAGNDSGHAERPVVMRWITGG